MRPTSPSAQLTVTGSPLVRSWVALPLPTTAGMPSSRETMAAWLVRPPRFVTMAEAVFMIGSQSGSVMSVTRISPAWNSRMCDTLGMTCTLPAAILSPTARPLTSSSPWPLRR